MTTCQGVDPQYAVGRSKGSGVCVCQSHHRDSAMVAENTHTAVIDANSIIDHIQATVLNGFSSRKSMQLVDLQIPVPPQGAGHIARSDGLEEAEVTGLCGRVEAQQSGPEVISSSSHLQTGQGVVVAVVQIGSDGARLATEPSIACAVTH